MPQVAIDNPILNSPFRDPARHFRFDEDGITSEIAEGRRRSTYFIPIPKPKTKGGAQLSLPGDWGGRADDRQRLHQPSARARRRLAERSLPRDHGGHVPSGPRSGMGGRP